MRNIVLTLVLTAAPCTWAAAPGASARALALAGTLPPKSERIAFCRRSHEFLPLFKSENRTTRLAAMRASAICKERRALKLLTYHLKNCRDTGEQAHAAIALGFYGRKALIAGDELLAATESPDFRVRAAAQAAMANIISPQSDELYITSVVGEIAALAARRQ